MARDIPVDFGRDDKGQLLSNDATIGNLIWWLAQAGIAQAQGDTEQARRIYDEVQENADKADEGRRKKEQ